MQRDPMKEDVIKKLKMQKRLSLLAVAIGTALMIYMITVESEPGAIPVLIVVAGAGWYLFTWSRLRSHHGRHG